MTPVRWDVQKCDIHRHLGGSIDPRTIWEIIVRDEAFHVAKSLDEVTKAMTYQQGEAFTFERFLQKFKIMDAIKWSVDSIELIINRMCANVAAEGIGYVEVSFSIDKYVKSLQMNPKDVVQLIANRFQEYSLYHGITTGLLLSLKYESDKDDQQLFASLINEDSTASLLAGIDLVGDESKFDVDFYVPIFERWRAAGKITRAHVGEIKSGMSNVGKAIRKLKVRRIAHGVQASNEEMIMAADNGVYFDLAIHSNLRTGVVGSIDTHAISRMISKGCLVTLNTDDPVQCGCSLDDEYKLALKHQLISQSDVLTIQNNSLDAISCNT